MVPKGLAPRLLTFLCPYFLYSSVSAHHTAVQLSKHSPVINPVHAFPVSVSSNIVGI